MIGGRPRAGRTGQLFVVASAILLTVVVGTAVYVTSLTATAPLTLELMRTDGTARATVARFSLIETADFMDRERAVDFGLSTWIGEWLYAAHASDANRAAYAVHDTRMLFLEN